MCLWLSDLARDLVQVFRIITVLASRQALRYNATGNGMLEWGGLVFLCYNAWMALTMLAIASLSSMLALRLLLQFLKTTS